MTKSAFLALAYKALRWYLGSGIFDRVAQLVLLLLNDDSKTGAQKRDTVLTFALAEFSAVSKLAISAAIEIVLLKISEET